MENAYSLTKSNQLFLVIGCILIAGTQLISPEYGFLSGNLDSELMRKLIGAIIGTALTMMFFPVVISWAVWRARGRAENAGSYTFNILFTIFVIIAVFVGLG
jgi:hypothetical protein